MKKFLFTITLTILAGLCLSLFSCAILLSTTTTTSIATTTTTSIATTTTTVPAQEGSLSSPLELSIGVTYNGSIGSDLPNYYKVVFVDSGDYTMTVSNWTGTGSLWNTVFETSDYAGSVWFHSTVSGYSSEYTFDSGTYYFEFENIGLTSGQFSWRIAPNI